MPNKSTVHLHLTRADVASKARETEDRLARMQRIGSKLRAANADIDQRFAPQIREEMESAHRNKALRSVQAEVLAGLDELDAELTAQIGYYDPSTVLERQAALDPVTGKPTRDPALDVASKALFAAEARSTSSAQLLAAAERAVAERDPARFVAIRREIQSRPRSEIGSETRIRVGLLAREFPLPESTETLAAIDKARRNIAQTRLLARELMRGKVDAVGRIRLGLDDRAREEAAR